MRKIINWIHPDVRLLIGLILILAAFSVMLDAIS